MLELFCKTHHDVLEFGSGGSTIFFAQRTHNVLALEGDRDWHRMVSEEAAKRGLFNADVRLSPTIDECIANIGDRKFDIILVDGSQNRHWSAKYAIRCVKKDGIVVVDNYDATYCMNCDVLFTGHLQTAYDDPHWVGKGTKVYYFN
jgi:predicted O-methyltransferase YrrM